MTTTSTPEMKELIADVRKAFGALFWSKDRFWYVERPILLGEDGGIPALIKDLKGVEAALDTYKKALRACEKQLRTEAAEIYAIVDLPMRIKSRLARMGCRTRVDVHLTRIWCYDTPGWGRKSEQVLKEWQRKHWSKDYGEFKEAERGRGLDPATTVYHERLDGKGRSEK